MAPRGAVILFPSFKNTEIFHDKKCVKGNKKKIQNVHKREPSPRISDTHCDGNPPLFPATPANTEKLTGSLWRSADFLAKNSVKT